MNLTIDKFQDFLLYSNKNIEKLVKRVVNESSNASLVALYEDSAILLDHKNGSFYSSEYKFNPNEGTLVFENFEEINLERDVSSFKDAVNNFFESEDKDVTTLTEAFQAFSSDQEAFIDSIVNESLSDKNFNEIIDYSALEGINESVEIKNEPFFKEYAERLSSHPMGAIKKFDWANPVKVSLVESEEVRFVNKNIKQKALNLYKNAEFKERVNEALEALKEGDESLVKVLAEDYSQIFLLDTADRKTVLAKAIISNSKLVENGRNSILAKVEKIFGEDEDVLAIRNVITEAEEESTDDTEGKDVPSELSDAEIEKLSKELEKVLDKVEDEKLGDKIEGLVKALEDSKEKGTDVETVKEAVEILSL